MFLGIFHKILSNSDVLSITHKEITKAYNFDIVRSVVIFRFSEKKIRHATGYGYWLIFFPCFVSYYFVNFFPRVLNEMQTFRNTFLKIFCIILCVRVICKYPG